MALEISGKLIQKFEGKTGEGGAKGTWRKREFLIETQNDYPKKILIAAWADKVDMIDKANIGDMLYMSIDIEAREYKDKWYNDIKVWKLKNDGGGTKSAKAPSESPDSTDGSSLPF